MKDFLECMSNLNLMISDHVNSYVENMKNYEDNELCVLVKSRLTENLSSFSKIDANNLHCECMLHNTDRACQITKMLKHAHQMTCFALLSIIMLHLA